jgi:hypothetical protein
MLVRWKPLDLDRDYKMATDASRRIGAFTGDYKRIGKQSLDGYNKANRLIGKIKLANQLLR